jgi:hypothetical protein
MKEQAQKVGNCYKLTSAISLSRSIRFQASGDLGRPAQTEARPKIEQAAIRRVTTMDSTSNSRPAKEYAPPGAPGPALET